MKDLEQSETRKDTLELYSERLYHTSFTVSCRESEIRFLCNYYKIVYTQNAHKLYSTLTPLIILGPAGSGKTLTIQLFGEDLEADVERYNYKFHFNFRYINCQDYYTIQSILTNVLTSFLPDFPQVGISNQDLIDSIEDMLSQTNEFVLVVLDEIDCITHDPNFNFLLQKLTSPNFKSHVSVIIISQDKSFLKYIDEDNNLLEITKNVLVFEKYSKEQIYTLLKERCPKDYGPTSI